MSKLTVSRRDFLGRSLVGLAVLGSGAAVSACGGSDGPDCANPPGLDAAKSAMRAQLHYNDHAADPNKQCQKCALFAGGASMDVCGQCNLQLGAVSPLGTCDSFAPRT